MSDSGGNSAIGEAIQTVNEAVVEPIKDEVGKMVEVGVQSITGSTSDPQKQARKQQEDQKKLAEAQYRIQWWKDLAAKQAGLNQQDKQEQAQKQQDKQEDKQVKQYEIVQKKQERKQAEEITRSRAELKAGKGVGG